MMREIKFRGLPTCKDNDELDYINFDRDGNLQMFELDERDLV